MVMKEFENVRFDGREYEETIAKQSTKGNVLTVISEQTVVRACHMQTLLDTCIVM